MSEDALKASYAALAATTNHEYLDVTISTGTVKLRPLSVPEAIIVTRDYPSLQNILLGGASSMPDDESGAYVMRAMLESGPEAIATLIVYCAGWKKQKAELVPLILDKSDDDIIALLQGAVEVTAPKGLADFSRRFQQYAGTLGLKPQSVAPVKEAKAA